MFNFLGIQLMLKNKDYNVETVDFDSGKKNKIGKWETRSTSLYLQ